VSENIRKKYQAFWGKETREEKIRIFPKGQSKLHIVKYKNFIIKGYTGELELAGPIELLQTALDSGLGSKNSQGFGCARKK